MKWKVSSGQVGSLELKSRQDFYKILVIIMWGLRNKSIFVPNWTPEKVRKIHIIRKCCAATFHYEREFWVWAKSSLWPDSLRCNCIITFFRLIQIQDMTPGMNALHIQIISIRIHMVGGSSLLQRAPVEESFLK